MLTRRNGWRNPAVAADGSWRAGSLPGAFAIAAVWMLAVAAGLVAEVAPAAAGLPDRRAYELVTRYEENGREVGLSGIEASYGVPSVSGDAVDWQSVGGCCGAAAAIANLYQSDRGAHGWQTKALTPVPAEQPAGLLEVQAPMFTTPDLEQTIFASAASYALGAHRPPGADDLYLEYPTGSLTWLSQGPFGSGSAPYSAEFDGATPDAHKVVFSTAEQLTTNATALAPLTIPPQYLYVRDVERGTTQLVDVDDGGALLNPDGASLGSGGWLHEEPIPVDREGVTTNAISADGSKIFFETPPPEVSDLPNNEVPHLFMRDLADNRTTPLDDPQSSGSARYEGAASDGSLVFFTSDEGLDGAAGERELYEFNTTTAPIGSAPPMSSAPISAGAFDGVSAISNDGTDVFLVAESVLAGNTNAQGRSATPGQPNLYDYDTRMGRMTFLATIAPSDIDTCYPDCASGRPTGLLDEPDVERPAYPTPDGAVFVFASTADLTGEDTEPATTLTAGAAIGQLTIDVADTAGFSPHQTVAIGSGPTEELDTVEAIDGPTELTLGEYGSHGHRGLSNERQVGERVAEVHAEIYRYDSESGSLLCISCTPPGVAPTESADLGAAGGGSYAPAGRAAGMSADGTRIFFDSSDPLLPEVRRDDGDASVTNVYEWENGSVALISDGAEGGLLDGTTPSGDDVFFSSGTRLVPSAAQDTVDIYDARVGGGFPQPPPPATQCLSQSCRPRESETVFLPTPGSATLFAVPNPEGPQAPRFAVAAITAAQRELLARSGRLTLRVTATAAGELRAEAEARLHGRSRRVAHARAALAGPGTVDLRLSLSAAARAQLADSGRLRLRIRVSYSASAIDGQAELRLVVSHRRGAAKARGGRLGRGRKPHLGRAAGRTHGRHA
jgi:hypothetical protein